VDRWDAADPADDEVLGFVQHSHAQAIDEEVDPDPEVLIEDLRDE
jgi:hypothetical protein